MKKLLKLAISYSLLCLLLFSCEWQPDETYIKNIDSNISPPFVELELDLLPENDTVYIYYNQMYFSFKSDNQKIRHINFYLNDNLSGTVSSTSGFFNLNLGNITPGYNLLRIELITEAGTRSIADQLGAEGFIFSTKEWTIHYQPHHSNNLTASFIDGFLKLRFLNPTSDQYIIYRDGTEIGRTNAFEYVDSSYIGQTATYTVSRQRGDGTIVHHGSLVTPFLIPGLRFIADEDNQYILQWDKLIMKEAIDSIWLVRSNNTIVFRSSDMNINQCLLPSSLFGAKHDFWLVISPKFPKSDYVHTFSSYQKYASPKLSCLIGYPSPAYTNFFGISNNELLIHRFFSNGDSLFRYDISDERISERFGFDAGPAYSKHLTNPMISPGRNFLSAIVGPSNYKAFISEVDNLENFRIAQIGSLTGYSFRPIPISDNGIGIIHGTQKYLYDFQNDTILDKINTVETLDSYTISSDGRFFVFKNSSFKLYSFHNHQINLLMNFNSTIGPFMHFNTFIPNEPNILVGWNKNNKKFYHYNCADLETVNEFVVPEETIINIDFLNNRILSFSPNLLVVRSLLNGSMEYSITVPFNSLTHNKCVLHGNSIYHNNGVRYFLN